jgi:alkaline phosphatase D
MRKLWLFIPLGLALVAWIVGCNETNPTEPTGIAESSFGVVAMPTASSSTFDSGAEGWTLVGDTEMGTGVSGNFWFQPLHTQDGNPGGAVYAIDEGRGLTWFWHAPPKFLGNRSGSYGRNLEYDIKIAGTGSIFWTADVILAGNGKTLSIAFVGSNIPGAEWKHYSVELSADANWRVQNPFSGAVATEQDLKEVLKDLNMLLIRGEYLNSVGDIGYLDNVRIVPKGLAN